MPSCRVKSSQHEKPLLKSKSVQQMWQQVLGVRREGVVDTRLLGSPKSFNSTTDCWTQFKFTFLGCAGVVNWRFNQARCIRGKRNHELRLACQRQPILNAVSPMLVDSRAAMLGPSAVLKNRSSRRALPCHLAHHRCEDQEFFFFFFQPLGSENEWQVRVACWVPGKLTKVAITKSGSTASTSMRDWSIAYPETTNVADQSRKRKGTHFTTTGRKGGIIICT